MSVQAISWVLTNSRAEHGARLALISLANHSNDEDEAWISVNTISEETLLSERAVRSALRRLIDLKEIAASGTHPKYKTVIYRLSTGQVQHLQGAKEVAESAPEPKASGVALVSTKGSSSTRSKNAKASTKKIHIPDRWPYFLQKLQAVDPKWQKVTIGACVKLAKQTSTDAVSTALSFAATDFPPDLESSAYGWLQATARGLHEAVVSA